MHYTSEIVLFCTEERPLTDARISSQIKGFMLDLGLGSQLFFVMCFSVVDKNVRIWFMMFNGSSWEMLQKASLEINICIWNIS